MGPRAGVGADRKGEKRARPDGRRCLSQSGWRVTVRVGARNCTLTEWGLGEKAFEETEKGLQIYEYAMRRRLCDTTTEKRPFYVVPV